MTTDTANKRLLAKTTLCEHIESCDECALGLAAVGDEELRTCPIGARLWLEYQRALPVRRDVLVNIAFGEQGNVISIIGLDSQDDAAAVHYWLGNHVLGCCDEHCPCVIAGYEKGREHQP